MVTQEEQKANRLLKSIDLTLIWIFWVNLGGVAVGLLLLVMLDDKMDMLMEVLK